MSTPAEAAATISTALEALVGIRHHRQMFGLVDPPATVLPPPTLRYGGMGDPDPTDATFVVALVVDRAGREQEQLLTLLPRVVEALMDLQDVVVNESRPGTYPSGGVDLPAYLIDIDVSL